MKPKQIALILLLVLLAACGSNIAEQAPTSQDTGGETVSTLPATEVPPTSTSSSSLENAVPSQTTPAVEEEPVQSEEQAVISSFPQPITANGETFILYGHVLDRSGQPLSGYAVEIWQVDTNGSYDHPNDPSTQNRDRNFQFYGTSVTDENGLFAFRTIIPARYEPRPRHIHFKVKKDGAEVLTSQFYFSGDVEAAQLGPAGEMLLLDPKEAQGINENSMKLALKNIVMNGDTGGNLTMTPAQGQGPYYPVVDVSAFDNDLASVQ